MPKRVGKPGSTSISQALSGNFKEESKDETITPSTYSKEVKVNDKPFTLEMLLEIWPSFAAKYVEQVHLYNTLSTSPQLIGDNAVKVIVENSVQQDQIRQLKPELIGFLRRSLSNSTIEVEIEMNRTLNEKKILTDEQKLQAMIQKNPALQLMKNKFNLDFNS